MQKIEIINDDHGGAPLGLLSLFSIIMVVVFAYGDPIGFIINPMMWIVAWVAVLCVKFDLKQVKHRRILSKIRNVPSLYDFYVINASLIIEDHPKSTIRLTIKGEMLTQDVLITHDFKFFEKYFSHVNESNIMQAPIPGRLVGDTFYIIESELLAILRRKMQITKIFGLGLGGE